MQIQKITCNRLPSLLKRTLSTLPASTALMNSLYLQLLPSGSWKSEPFFTTGALCDWGSKFKEPCCLWSFWTASGYIEKVQVSLDLFATVHVGSPCGNRHKIANENLLSFAVRNPDDSSVLCTVPQLAHCRTRAIVLVRAGSYRGVQNMLWCDIACCDLRLAAK